MMRVFVAISLSFVLAFTSISMAVARGQNSDISAEIVICTGVGLTTITLGPDGEPVKTTHVCPDSLSIFAASFSVPGLSEPASRLIARLQPRAHMPGQAQEALAPSARGPPRVV